MPEAPRGPPSTSECSVNSPLTAWSAALRRTPSILFQGWIHNPPPLVCSLSRCQASHSAPASSATPSCSASSRKGGFSPTLFQTEINAGFSSTYRADTSPQSSRTPLWILASAARLPLVSDPCQSPCVKPPPTQLLGVPTHSVTARPAPSTAAGGGAGSQNTSSWIQHNMIVYRSCLKTEHEEQSCSQLTLVNMYISYKT